MARLSSPKAKGDAYERELAHRLNEAVFDGQEQCYRAPLSGGGRSFAHSVDAATKGGSADLLGTPGLWVEAKRTERFQPYEAMAQAERGRDSRKTGEVCVVVTRRSRMPIEKSLVVLRLEDFERLYRTWLGAQD